MPYSFLDRRDVTLVGRNEQTGLVAAFVGSDPDYITVYTKKAKLEPWEERQGGQDYAALRILCKPGEESQQLYKYGKSKTIHWNTNCAKANATQEPTKVQHIDAVLAGHKECKNCWGRTRSIRG